MATLAEQITQLKTSVAANKTAGDSAVDLINRIKQMNLDAYNRGIADGATPEMLAGLADVNTFLETDTVALATAVANGTPSPEPPVLASKRAK